MMVANQGTKRQDKSTETSRKNNIDRHTGSPDSGIPKHRV